MGSLEDRVAILEKQVHGLLIALNPDGARAETGSIDPVTGEIYGASNEFVPRGKYAGRKHADIVQTDPHHVVWLSDNAKAMGLGYTTEDVAKARMLAQTVPEKRRYSPSR